jgi:hypothetical protein
MPTRIKLLIVLHLVGVPYLSHLSAGHYWPHLSAVAAHAAQGADAALVGLWAALGRTPIWLRFPVAIVALTGLWLSMALDPNSSSTVAMRWNLLYACLPAIAVFGAIRCFRWQNKRVYVYRDMQSPERFQLTIKQLLILTTAVAVVFAIGRGLYVSNHTGGIGYMFARPIVTSSCSAAVGLAVFWAALGIGRPLWRLLLVVPASGLVGFVPPLYHPWVAPVAIDWVRMMWIEAAITAATLLVVRSCGWRLCIAVTDPNQLAANKLERE